MSDADIRRAKKLMDEEPSYETWLDLVRILHRCGEANAHFGYWEKVWINKDPKDYYNLWVDTKSCPGPDWRPAFITSIGAAISRRNREILTVKVVTNEAEETIMWDMGWDYFKAHLVKLLRAAMPEAFKPGMSIGHESDEALAEEVFKLLCEHPEQAKGFWLKTTLVRTNNGREFTKHDFRKQIELQL